ncbi:hypothetical protein C4B60_10500 [Jeotgalibacillus proteolyticus]|uniref:Uncharacterized protein n=1 Tax=Jeotgalibacillus proteolyticus TaxID=2082395 RepID=A0A2S5GAG8_9BACL|nr:hypothetical protein C4B60_10500 [Jeotgalibacillus proteolyticus]
MFAVSPFLCVILQYISHKPVRISQIFYIRVLMFFIKLIYLLSCFFEKSKLILKAINKTDKSPHHSIWQGLNFIDAPKQA